jgi:hypothetical protein
MGHPENVWEKDWTKTSCRKKSKWHGDSFRVTHFSPKLTQTSMKTLIHTLLISLAALNFACADEAKAPAPLKVGEFTLKPAADWQAKAEPRMMSQGGYALQKDGKLVLEADFYHFGSGQGGNVESNIARWEGQFQPGKDGAKPIAKRTTMKFGEQKAIIVELKGTFMSGSPVGPKTPKEGHAMLGAILESKDGSVFVKATAPEADVAAGKEAFMKLISSAYAVPGVEEKAEKADDTKKAPEGASK